MMGEESWYVFCITEGEEPPRVEPPLAVISCKDLHAVVRPASPDEFDAIEPDGEGNLPPVLTELLFRHDQVIRSLFALHNLLPMRFGMGVDSQEGFRRYLEERHGDLLEQLSRVRGHVEWGIKWELPPAKPGAQAAAQAGAQGAGRETGRSYLRSRQQELRADQDRTRLFRSQVERAHRLLSKLCGEVLPGSNNGAEAGCAYLVPREQEERFLDLAEGLERELARVSIRMRLTGPWPAYSFTGGRQAGERQVEDEVTSWTLRP